MFLTVHTAAAIAISQQTPNPLLAFVLAIFSHFLLDLVPHGDKDFDVWLPKGNNKKLKLIVIAITDLIIMISGLGYLLQAKQLNYPWSTLLAIYGGVLPDFLVGVATIYNLKFLKIFDQINDCCHRATKKLSDQISFPVGLLIQITVLIAALYLI